MNRVARSEAGFLRFVRMVVRGAPVAQLARILARAQPLNDRIGETAMGVVKTTLARGLVVELARNGGWRNEPRPVDGDLVTGRLWDRHATPSLTFSGWSFAVLRWAYTTAVIPPVGVPEPPQVLPNGDRLVAWALARALGSCELVGAGACVVFEPLAALQLAGRAPSPAVDWSAWLVEGAVLLEGVSESIGRSWAAVESSKLALTEPADLVQLGNAQARLLTPLLDALHAADRLDLADFLLFAGEHLVVDPSKPPVLVPTELRASRSIRERAAATRASAAFASSIGVLEGRLQSARVTRFFDDDYDAAQARLARWERFGPARATLFRNTAAELLDPSL